MIVDKPSLLQVFGCLMKHPQYLSEKDKYTLTLEDFYYKFDRYVFIAISNLYEGGATRIQPIDVENYLASNASASIIFKNNNGIEYLQDAFDLSEAYNFEYYYSKLKKINLLNQLSESGFDISKYYISDLTNLQAADVNEKFEDLTAQDILDDIKKATLKIEREFVKNDSTETRSAFEGIQDIIDAAEDGTDVGIPLQGELFNEIIGGARKGTFIVRSAGSGTGKSRTAVGDACVLAYPFRYDEVTRSWIQCGANEKVLFIATEQSIGEIQKMVIAYLTGFNESKFRYGHFTDSEKHIIKQALYIMERFQDNLFIMQMPNPSIELIKSTVREQVLLRGIEYVFYDYIFIDTGLMREFKGETLRHDELLLLMSTALKNLAVELNIFVMTSTQVNANADNTTGIKNESSIAGSRSVINKADVGAVMSRPTKEDLDFLTQQGYEIPNMVTDIYKVRSGQWTQVKIWSNVDLGNLRKKDLYVTDSRYNIIHITDKNFEYVVDWENSELLEALERVNNIK